ncbi:glutathione reductase [Acetobacter nitrogenifigens DSM 23921 = NBRC 105050]|uniref:Glutathione-disulfide reductase n=1 Tax=Acetobacter nitrogenifigens DSM 23921 = NBRC 105050 TaxID=1120919 RepID=A0A511XDS7_9PROT|nr:glutathione-disulfide reductase [Acetobacter nitrogenifigens]GBQ96854.1 glutathione reductase [Acetobacter nitrogenifigens DSM 23921 = NBRC 105050]GEN61102.1 glutathione-disulfide reductase [Acetobacter nitrogenifigens DSM 23921 = NBRC 105050]
MSDNAAYDVDLLVIGAGSGGVRCARIAAGHGARVAIIEARHWGGTCVNLGCVPKKLMVQASEYPDYVADSHGFGWDTQPGHHDWKMLIAAKDREIERLNGIYVSMLEKNGVRLITGFARFEDAHTVVTEPTPLSPDAKPERITAARIVIASGSTPTKLDIEGVDLAITSDEVFHLAEMPRRVCIVGSGYIGVEFAGIFAGLGAEVDLVYRQPLPLRGFDEDLRSALHTAIDQRGVRQHVKASPTSIRRNGDAFVVTLDSGVEIEADCVMLATGRHPKTSGLALEKAGVRLDDGGRIAVDAASQTSTPDIYAIGDVTNRINLTPVAIAEGHILADYLFAGHEREWAFDTTPKAVFFTPPLASVGLTEDEAAERGPADIYVSSFRPMRHTLSGRERRTLMKLVVDQASQKVVGAHMLGEDAPELMQGLAIAVTAGLRKADFDRTIGIHPTSGEEFVTMRSRTRVAGA